MIGMNIHPPNGVSLHDAVMCNRMKRAPFFLLLAILALPSCETTHNAAVATFRVIDAPHVYLRRKLGVNEEPGTTTTTTTTTETNVPPEGSTYPQQYPAQYPPPTRVVTAPPPPPPPTQRRVVTSESNREPEQESRPAPTATPRLARTSSTASAPRTTEPQGSPAARTAASQKSEIPYAKPVPGKPGYVFSPFDKDGGYVDVTGYSPGSKVKDPYTGKIFLVP